MSLLDFVKSLGAKRVRCEAEDDLIIDALQWAQIAKPLLAARPLRSLRLLKATDSDLVAALATPELSQISRLSLDNNKLGDDGVRALITCPNLGGVVELDLTWCGMSGRTTKLFAGADPRRFPALRSLILCGNPSGAVGVRALAGSALLAQLTSLDLTALHGGDEAMAELFASRVIMNLERMVIDRNECAALSRAALLANPHAARLVTLDFDDPDVAARLALNLHPKRPYVEPEAPPPVEAVETLAPDSRGAELVAKLAGDPDDQATRLVYTDWLHERSDPRAAWIVLEQQLAGSPDDPTLQRKAETLRHRMEQRFRQRFKNKQAVLEHAHGMIVHVGGAQHWFLQRGAEMLASEPISSVGLYPASAATMKQLATIPGMQQVRWLEIRLVTPKHLAAVPLAALPALSITLDSLGVEQNPGLEAYLDMPELPRVRGLGFYRLPAAFAELANDPRLAHIVRVDVGRLGNDAARRVLAAPWKLERVTVGDVDDDLYEALCAKVPTVICSPRARANYPAR